MPARDDTPQLRDIPAAIGLLTRLPVRVDTGHATARGAQAAWAYPLAGIVVALTAWGVATITLWLDMQVAAAAGLTLATLIITTGAMHEDGLADSADGLWGGWTPARRLEIMKDSNIGAYGVIALILSLGLRWQALTLLIVVDALAPALIVTAVVSRAAMVPVMTYLPNARTSGLSHTVGKPTSKTALIACGLAAIIALIFLGFGALWLYFAAVLTTVTCAAIARAKINGQTGDILGATQQITEITALLTLTALAF